MTLKNDLTPWELLGYYTEKDTQRQELKDWHGQGRKKLHNIELPFKYSGFFRLFIDHQTSDESTRKLLYESREFPWLGGPYTDMVINNAIRLGLKESLQEHHKNRIAVAKILQSVFADNWASKYVNENEDIVAKTLIARIKDCASGFIQK